MLPIDHDFCPDALLAGLYLKNKSSRIKAALLLLVKQKGILSRFIESKHSNQVLEIIIQSICRYKHWKNNQEIYSIGLDFLKKALTAKPELIEKAGPLKLYKILHYPKVDHELLGQICSGFTMTGANIISLSYSCINILMKSAYAMKAIPFMSKEILNFLSQKNSYLNGIQILQVLQATPIWLRRRNPEKIITILINALTKYLSQYTSDILIKAFIILREILYEGMNAQANNKSGICYKNEKRYNSSVVMMYCEKCKQYMCLVCGSSHLETTKTIKKHGKSEIESHPMKYIKSSEQCEANSNNTGFANILNNAPETQMVFFDSQGNKNDQNEFSSESCTEEINITSFKEINDVYDDSNRTNLFYFEVEIIDAGVSENISIGIDGTGVFYLGNTGKIIDAQGVNVNAPRFGTGDTIGIGLTSDHYLYFTFNGYNLHLYKKCEPDGEIRPQVKIKGKHINVKIITHDFYFLKGEYPKEKLKNLQEFLNVAVDYLQKINSQKETLEKIKEHAEGVIPIDFSISPEVKKTKNHEYKACQKGCIIS